MWEKLRTRAQHQAERLKRELRTYRLLLVDPRTPKTSKWLLGAALAYIMSPIDLIPDFIPVLGYLDDLVIVPTLVFLALRMIPDEVVADCRNRAEGVTQFGRQGKAE